jgi:serpin B
MNHVLPAALLAVLALPLVPLARAGADEGAKDPAQALAAAENAFAWDLYGAVRGGDGNLFFSPWSVHAAMLMTREGAAGRTAAQMDAALHVAGLDRGAGYRALTAALKAPLIRQGWEREAPKVPAYEIHVANALWGQQGFAFEAPFLKTLQEVYGAPLQSLDFKDNAAARKRINDWVATQTRDKIRDIVPPGMPPPLTRLALANAIYYKAQWMHPFAKRSTKEGDFTGPGDVVSKAQLMRQVEHFAYGEIDGVQVLEMPYVSRRTSMVIFLPKAKDGLASLEERLARDGLRGWEKKLM